MLKENTGLTDREKFAGTWTLVSVEFRRADGTVSSAMGAEMTGTLSYDANGHMAVQMMRPDRLYFSSGDQLAGTPEEVRAAIEGYIAYFGDYIVTEEEQSVIHRTKGALLPNLVEKDQKRFYRFSENQLTLTSLPFTLGGVSVTGILVWERNL